MSILFRQRCDLYKSAEAEGRLGSPSEQTVIVRANVKCTYTKKRERAVNTAQAQLTQVQMEMLIVPHDETVQEGWIVKNIRERRGDVIEAGPFLIETAVPEMHLGGSQAHQMLTLKRSYA